jgi:hypothetical protein
MEKILRDARASAAWFRPPPALNTTAAVDDGIFFSPNGRLKLIVIYFSKRSGFLPTSLQLKSYISPSFQSVGKLILNIDPIAGLVALVNTSHELNALACGERLKAHLLVIIPSL